MSDSVISCPCCRSNHIVKNGFIHNRNQNFKRKDCGRQFVLDPKNKMIGEETKNLIDAPTIRKNPLAAIARGVTETAPQSPLELGDLESNLRIVMTAIHISQQRLLLVLQV